MTIGLPTPIGSPVPFDASRQGVVERTAFARLWLPPTLIGDCKAKNLIGVVDVYDTHEARLYEIDLSGWSPGAPPTPRHVLTLPQPWIGLNGGCLLASDVLLTAGMAGRIWRDGQADAITNPSTGNLPVGAPFQLRDP